MKCPKCYHIFNAIRSNPQNSYYWGVIIAHYVGLDYGYTASEWHDMLRSEFLFYCKKVNGFEVKFLKSTQDINKSEAEKYYEDCRNHYSLLTDHKYFIPLPNEREYE